MMIQKRIRRLILLTSICHLCAISATGPDVDLPKLPLGICNAGSSQSVPEVAINNNGSTLQLFQAGFSPATWSGYLRKFSVGYDAEKGSNIPKQAEWDAAEILTDKTQPVNRKIFTFDPTTKTTSPFQLRSLPDTTRALFNRAPSGSDKDGLGEERVDYLYGDRQFESTANSKQKALFRKRDKILGDIVNSAPVYVRGADKSNTGNQAAEFIEKYQNRPGTVYVGANDGMLHAFSAESGVEFFSYIPSPLLDKLPALTYPSYSHDSLMDGKITVKDVQISGKWKTVLAFGMGGGAKGVIALDVTSPDKFGADGGAIFEFTEKDDADVGYLLTAPSLIKLRTKPSDPNGEYFLAFPNGYNASNQQGDTFLFLLSLNKNANTPWTLNKDYYKLKIASSNPTLPNALTTPGLVLDWDGTSIYAYAGDLFGNIWRFDFSDNKPLDTIKPVNIFTAVDPLNKPQPITAAPVVSFAPDNGYLILFGTGKFVEASDTNPSMFQTNSFYALSDNKALEKSSYHIDDRSKLARRVLVESTDSTGKGYKVSGQGFQFGNAFADSTKRGWFVDLPAGTETGERITSSALIANGTVSFNSFTPSCSSAQQSRSYSLDLTTGKTPDSQTLTGRIQHVGVPASPILILNKTDFGQPNAIGQRTNIQHFSILNFGSNSANSTAIAVSIESIQVQQQAGRLSWREIQNWQDLNSPPH